METPKVLCDEIGNLLGDICPHTEEKKISGFLGTSQRNGRSAWGELPFPPEVPALQERCAQPEADQRSQKVLMSSTRFSKYATNVYCSRNLKKVNISFIIFSFEDLDLLLKK